MGDTSWPCLGWDKRLLLHVPAPKRSVLHPFPPSEDRNPSPGAAGWRDAHHPAALPARRSGRSQTPPSGCDSKKRPGVRGGKAPHPCQPWSSPAGLPARGTRFRTSPVFLPPPPRRGTTIPEGQPPPPRRRRKCVTRAGPSHRPGPRLEHGMAARLRLW